MNITKDIHVVIFVPTAVSDLGEVTVVPAAFDPDITRC